jgi:hypothetical protein
MLEYWNIGLKYEQKFLYLYTATLNTTKDVMYIISLFHFCGSSGFRVGSIPLLRLRGGRESYEILTK